MVELGSVGESMKGYRTPSWFRMKGRLKVGQVKAQSSKPKAPRTKKGK